MGNVSQIQTSIPPPTVTPPSPQIFPFGAGAGGPAGGPPGGPAPRTVGSPTVESKEDYVAGMQQPRRGDPQQTGDISRMAVPDRIEMIRKSGGGVDLAASLSAFAASLWAKQNNNPNLGTAVMGFLKGFTEERADQRVRAGEALIAEEEGVRNILSSVRGLINEKQFEGALALIEQHRARLGNSQADAMIATTERFIGRDHTNISRQSELDADATFTRAENHIGTAADNPDVSKEKLLGIISYYSSLPEDRIARLRAYVDSLSSKDGVEVRNALLSTTDSNGVRVVMGSPRFKQYMEANPAFEKLARQRLNNFTASEQAVKNTRMDEQLRRTIGFAVKYAADNDWEKAAIASLGYRNPDGSIMFSGHPTEDQEKAIEEESERLQSLGRLNFVREFVTSVVGAAAIDMDDAMRYDLEEEMYDYANHIFDKTLMARPEAEADRIFLSLMQNQTGEFTQEDLNSMLAEVDMLMGKDSPVFQRISSTVGDLVKKLLQEEFTFKSADMVNPEAQGTSQASRDQRRQQQTDKINNAAVERNSLIFGDPVNGGSANGQ